MDDNKVIVWCLGLFFGFILFVTVILWMFDEDKKELIAKHQQNIETIKVLEKRIEVIEEQLKFTYWLLPDGEKK